MAKVPELPFQGPHVILIINKTFIWGITKGIHNIYLKLKC